MNCDGTGCTKRARNRVKIRVSVAHGSANVYRYYCADCTAKARRRTESTVVDVKPMDSNGAVE